MRWRALAALLLVSGLLPSCGGNKAVTPTPPPPSSPTLVSVTVAGALSVYAGSTAQLTATANFAKGTTQDVTTQAVWTSGNPSIATVSASGLLRGVALGNADITATYQNVTGTLRVSVGRQPTYTLSGTVTETFPTSSTVLSGTRVDILDGPNQGKSATTDGNGQYQISGLLGGTGSVRAHHDNYGDVTSLVTIASDTTLAFALKPTPVQVNERFNSNVSGGGPSSCALQGGTAQFPCRVFPFALHNGGSLEATLGWQTTDEAIFVLQLYNDDTNQILSQTPVTPSETNTQTLLNLAAVMNTPGNYQLRVVAWRITSTISFTLLVTRMN